VEKMRYLVIIILVWVPRDKFILLLIITYFIPHKEIQMISPARGKLQ